MSSDCELYAEMDRRAITLREDFTNDKMDIGMGSGHDRHDIPDVFHAKNEIILRILDFMFYVMERRWIPKTGEKVYRFKCFFFNHFFK